MSNNNSAIIQALQQKFGSADWKKWSMHRWAFWDYVRYANAGVSSLSFFANGQGSTDPVSTLAKTQEQTNIDRSRSFGQVYFMLAQIRTHIHILPKNRQLSGISDDANVITTTYTDMMYAMQRLAGQGVLTLDILAKNYVEIEQPFRTCPPGMGVKIGQHASSQITEAAWWQQNPDMGNLKNFTPPTIIEPEQTFDCKINFPNANSPAIPTVSSAAPAVNIGVIFEGYILRPAQ